MVIGGGIGARGSKAKDAANTKEVAPLLAKNIQMYDNIILLLLLPHLGKLSKVLKIDGIITVNISV